MYLGETLKIYNYLHFKLQMSRQLLMKICPVGESGKLKM